MNNADYTKLSRKQLLEQMEAERLEWLSLGMSEADIYRIHFGEEHENSRGGDYGVWLSERKHCRSDHKYSPGAPVAIESVKYEGYWFNGIAAADVLLSAEQTIDIEAMFQTLTSKQRELARSLVFDGISPAEYAQDHHISRSAVSQVLTTVRKNLKKFYGQP